MQKEIQVTKLTRVGLWMAAAGFFIWVVDRIDYILRYFSASYLNVLTKILSNQQIFSVYDNIWAIIFCLLGLGFALVSTICPRWLHFLSIVLSVSFLIHSGVNFYRWFVKDIYLENWDNSVMILGTILQNAFVAVFVSSLILTGLSSMFYTKRTIIRALAFVTAFFWVWKGFSEMYFVFFTAMTYHSNLYIDDVMIYDYWEKLKWIHITSSFFEIAACIATIILFIFLATAKEYKKIRKEEIQEPEKINI